MGFLMKQQAIIIKEFCKNAKYFFVKFPSKGEEEFGRILKPQDFDEGIFINLKENEIYRSIEEKDENRLFVYSLKPIEIDQITDNPLQLLINNLEDAKKIDKVYPAIFKWVFDGLCIKAYALIPSGDEKSHSTITRFGGTEMFMKILRQHLANIRKMSLGITPNYNFIKINESIHETELSIGSINLFNRHYSIGVTPNMSYMEIIKNSRRNIQDETPLTTLNMKYWAREVNPDFLEESRHIKLKTPIGIDMEFKLYPEAIKRLMALKYKGNHNRFLLARFLLSVHNPRDAKFIYDSVMGDEEKRHIETGNCKTQWNYLLNNIKRYDCPTAEELKVFWPKNSPIHHPLEYIQEFLNKKQNMVNNNEMAK